MLTLLGSFSYFPFMVFIKILQNVQIVLYYSKFIGHPTVASKCTQVTEASLTRRYLASVYSAQDADDSSKSSQTVSTKFLCTLYTNCKCVLEKGKAKTPFLDANRPCAKRFPFQRLLWMFPLNIFIERLSDEQHSDANWSQRLQTYSISSFRAGHLISLIISLSGENRIVWTSSRPNTRSKRLWQFVYRLRLFESTMRREQHWWANLAIAYSAIRPH